MYVDDYYYYILNNFGFSIIEISTSKKKSSFDLPGDKIMFTFLSNKAVYVAEGNKGVVILDCSDSTNV
jgi:hypothetical protein